MNFSILGTGMVAAYHKTAIETNAPSGARLHSVSHYDTLKYAGLSQSFGVPCMAYEEILDDEAVDVVCICTPSGQHAAQTIAAARAGKHVIVEKPIALSVNDADAMIEAARSNDVLLAVAFQRRMEPVFNLIKRAIAGGDLGTCTMASVVLPYYRGQDYYDQASWRGTWALDGGGVLMNQGIHIIDLLVWFMGDPVHIEAQAGTLQRQIEVEDAIVATLRFENDALATVAATTTIGDGAPHRIEIYGTNGSIQVEGEYVIRWHLKDRSLQTIDPPALAEEADLGSSNDPRGISATGHTAIFKDMMDAIRTKRAPAIDGHEGRRSLATVNGIYKAAGLIAAL